VEILEESMTALLATFFASVQDWLIPAIAIMFVFSIPIVAIVTDYFQKRNKARLIEKAVEKGVPVENLVLEEPKRRLPYRSGMVTVAVGLGIIILAFALQTMPIAPEMDDEGPPLAFFFGGGAICVLIGIALLINDRINYDRFADRNGNGRPKSDY
jgi:hypothetical protein